MAEQRPVALVTGGARGIGLGIARALAADGWDLALAGVRATSDVSEVLTSIADHGGRVHYVQADIARSADRAHLVAEVARVLGPPSALVNNAGRGPRVRADLLEATEESFAEVVDTNLRGRTSSRKRSRAP